MPLLIPSDIGKQEGKVMKEAMSHQAWCTRQSPRMIRVLLTGTKEAK
jgi:hypothetical protein